MNQMVNQLMLGQPLYGSTGAPNYDPLWMPVHTWIFAARAFPYTSFKREITVITQPLRAPYTSRVFHGNFPQRHRKSRSGPLV